MIRYIGDAPAIPATPANVHVPAPHTGCAGNSAAITTLEEEVPVGQKPQIDILLLKKEQGEMQEMPASARIILLAWWSIWGI